MNDTPSRNLITIIGLATATLIALSALPLSKLTGNILKDFDLFEDLFPAEYTVVFEADVVAPDPELSQFLAETTAKKDTEMSSGCEGAEETEAVSSATESSSQHPVSSSQNYTVIAGDIENYGESNSLAKLRTALSQSSSKQVRIAVAGDSFIEGDILTQDLRELFQNRYGGSGVGFMSMHTDFPGFRKTVRQTDKGWTMRDIRTMRGSDTIRALSGDYAISNGKASTTFKGVDRSEHTSQWTRSSAMFIAPNGGSVLLAGFRTSCEPRSTEFGIKRSHIQIPYRNEHAGYYRSWCISRQRCGSSGGLYVGSRQYGYKSSQAQQLINSVDACEYRLQPYNNGVRRKRTLCETIRLYGLHAGAYSFGQSDKGSIPQRRHYPYGNCRPRP